MAASNFGQKKPDQNSGFLAGKQWLSAIIFLLFLAIGTFFNCGKEKA
ncbi:MAG: hypothetical protein GWP06_18830 [Actinobacteria bacterium]|nr:hypothetical protein [Actinomycetota bacterium]